MVRRAQTATSQTCTPGPKCICRVRVGWAWTRPPDCSRAKGTFRSRPHRSRLRPRRFRAQWTHAKSRSRMRWRCGECSQIHASRYTDEQWERILALGCQVDREICSGDVRLTMGGEPTFVSIDNMEGAEWNTAALGAEKRKLAGGLLERLRERFAPGGLLHYGQGKWYPGEPLPRWALGCYWRKDGEPIWRDPALFAADSGAGSAALG